MADFYGYFRSSAAYRCRIAFNLKGYHPQNRFVHLRKGEQQAASYRALNPQALVPVLVLDDEHRITQSMAILEWLEETVEGASLLPADPHERASIRAFAQMICCDIHPLQNLRVLNYLRNDLHHTEAEAVAWCRKWIADGLMACEAVLAERKETRFCFGETPTFADIALIPQLYSARRFGVELDMPRILNVASHCEALQAFADAHPDRQPDRDMPEAVAGR